MRVRKTLEGPSAQRDDGEGGATAVIVVLSLVALFGLIVLTVDVGQLLFQRRIMVNASDAAALAAAQSCAGLDDTDVPESMADTFALSNSGSAITAGVNIIEMVGCDGPPRGHVTVGYGMNQDLFFAGVLGFDGPAAVSTKATAGWGPVSEGSPLPIVVYTGNDQGNCDIEEGTFPDGPLPGEKCYLWYDNDLFENSAFGFLNLCTDTDPCTPGWDVSGDASCPNVGTSLRDAWIAGGWNGGPNNINAPPTPTYVCRVSGLSSSNWSALDLRTGEDLLFPVNDCTTQVDTNGNIVGCDVAPDKYNIVGFITLQLEAVHDSAAEWGGIAQTHCSANNVDVTPGLVIPLSSFPGGQCPNGSTPSGVLNFEIDDQASSTDWDYDDTNKEFTWTGGPDRVNVDFDWWLDGKCGQPPNNSSAVCLQVVTVEVQWGGTDFCEGDCADFGTRGVRLCDLAIGSCP